MDKLKLVKNVVFVLTFVLIFGSMLLLGSLFKKTRQKAITLPSNTSLEQPIGSNIENIVEQDGYLYILVKNGGLSDRIIVLDTKSAKKLSEINLN